MNRPKQIKKQSQKQRTHKGASKRFKVTAGGKILHRKQNSRHCFAGLTGSQRRRKRGLKIVKGRMELKLKKMLALA